MSIPDHTEFLKNTGWRRIQNASAFSMNGLKACLRTEEAFQQELVLAILAVPLGLFLGDTGAEKALLAGSVILVLIVELVNTAIERAIDRISFDRHELSKEAKDMGSAAVMLALILAGVVWLSILIF